MNIRYEQLEKQLQQELKPLYLIAGDEALIIQESCDAIRNTASKSGYTNRTVFHVDADFKWEELFYCSNAISLFAEQNILELRLTKKPDKHGCAALLRYAQTATNNNILIITTPKLDKRTQNQKWFQAINKIGVAIIVWPISPEQLPSWIQNRMQQQGLAPQQDAVKLLAELVEGNLLAANQEITKLSLIYQTNEITAKMVTDAVSNNSRYNIFNLIDTTLNGDVSHALHIINELQSEGAHALAIIWGLSQELRKLVQIKCAVEKGQSLHQAMQDQGIWRNKQAITSKALSHLSLNTLQHINLAIASADQITKGMTNGKVWDQLEAIIMTMTGSKPISFH